MLNSFKNVLSVKLDNENYLLWKQQVMAAICGHNLLHYLEASSRPPKYLTTQDEISGSINVDFNEWEQQDQLLVSWLLPSMTEGILTRMIGCDNVS